MPALLIRIWIVPNLSTVFSTSLRQSSSRETSVIQTRASLPIPVISFPSVDSRSAERAAITTLLPCLANLSAVALPMPDEAPVTITTLSRKKLRSICSHIGDKYNENLPLVA